MFTNKLTGIILASAFTSTTKAGSGDFNYIENGADWPNDYPECALTNQSPIDLSTSFSDYTNYPASFDNFNKLYTNQVEDITIEWKNGHTTQVAVNKEGQDTQTFSSTVASDVFGANKLFTGVQFHFHAGSEHTIDGERYDFEMHTVHLAHETLEGFGYAALGIMFDTEKYDKSVTDEEVAIINRFFDSMTWTEENDPVVAEVPYGEIMMMADTDNRWVYKGSVTTPPCGQSVFWNVVSKVYPIRPSDLALFKSQLSRGDYDLETTGNYRVIQEVDEHNVVFVTNREASSTAMVLGILLLILVVINICVLIYFVMQRKMAYEKMSRTANMQNEMSEKQSQQKILDNDEEGIQIKNADA